MHRFKLNNMFEFFGVNFTERQERNKYKQQSYFFMGYIKLSKRGLLIIDYTNILQLQ